MVIIAIIFGLVTSWDLKKNMIFDLRAWGEMNLAMFSYYLSLYVGKQAYGKAISIFLKVVEIIGYFFPVILGIIPIKQTNQPICMSVTGLCTFCAIFITFANKGNIIESEKVNNAFGYLGRISLPIYIFHPVIIILMDYVYEECPKYAKYLIVFSSALILSFAYRIIADILNKKIEERNKSKKEEKESVMIKEEINVEVKESNGNNKEEEDNNNKMLVKEN